MTPSNPQAFPSDYETTYNGMTLRDYFANSAMQGICVNAGRNSFDFNRIEEISLKAYEIADAMLKQREL
jgi:hypothetical protein